MYASRRCLAFEMPMQLRTSGYAHLQRQASLLSATACRVRVASVPALGSCTRMSCFSDRSCSQIRREARCWCNRLSGAR
jgi:hypothetical protein